MNKLILLNNSLELGLAMGMMKNLGFKPLNKNINKETFMQFPILINYSDNYRWTKPVEAEVSAMKIDDLIEECSRFHTEKNFYVEVVDNLYDFKYMSLMGLESDFKRAKKSINRTMEVHESYCGINCNVTARIKYTRQNYCAIKNVKIIEAPLFKSYQGIGDRDLENGKVNSKTTKRQYFELTVASPASIPECSENFILENSDNRRMAYITPNYNSNAPDHLFNNQRIPINLMLDNKPSNFFYYTLFV